MKLTEMIAKKGFSGNMFAKKLDTMGKNKFLDYKDDPGWFRVRELKEMALILDTSLPELMLDLELI